MPLSTTFALLASLAAGKPKKDPRDVEIGALKAQVDDLKRERDEWRAVARGYRDLMNDGTLRRANPLGEATQVAQFMQAQQQAAQNPVAQNMMAQNLVQQSPHNLVGLGQYQMAQCLNPENWCNCVPARHDLFLPPGKRL